MINRSSTEGLIEIPGLGGECTQQNPSSYFQLIKYYLFLLRSKNTVNILIKNMLDAFIGCVSYWAIGWGLAYGEGGNMFCGGSQFFNYQLPYQLYAKWFFQVCPFITLTIWFSLTLHCWKWVL